MNINELAATFYTLLLSAIYAARGGNKAEAHALFEAIAEKTGAELWEVIEAYYIVNEKNFGDEAPYEAAAKASAVKLAKQESDKKAALRVGSGIVNPTTAAFDGAILARQERSHYFDLA